MFGSTCTLQHITHSNILVSMNRKQIMYTQFHAVLVWHLATSCKRAETRKSALFKKEWRYKQAMIGCKQLGNRTSESTGIRPLQR